MNIGFLIRLTRNTSYVEMSVYEKIETEQK